MKRTLLLFALFNLYQTTFAQSLQIKGKITSGKLPVEFANVILQTNDSAFITGGVTDERGRFYMENVQKGKYNLKISGIGYKTRNIDLPNFTSTLDLGNITIDSVAFELSEVTVTASAVINQPDKKLVFPTAHQLKASNDGLSLLQQLKLNRIQVNPMKQEVTSSNKGEVQLRINGSKAEIQDIMAIRPEDVIRIEYHDDPSLRYGSNAAAVIDYIVRHRETGGYVGLETAISPSVNWNNNKVSAKVNHKNSEFAVNYRNGFRGFDNYWRENTEVFNYQNGKTFTRTEDGIPDKTKMNWHFLNVNYSYQEADKWFLNIALRDNNNSNKIHTSSYLYPINDSSNKVLMKDYNSENSNLPSVDLYLQRELRNKQSLILNAVGTYIYSTADRDYKENKNSINITDIYSKTRGDKYSFIGEGIYEKRFATSKFSTGIRHKQTFTKNNYSGTTSALTNMQEAQTTAYVEYISKINKFNYSVGLQGNRSWFKQSNDGFQKYAILPRLRLTYNISDNAYIKYQGQINSLAPDLADLNNVQQIIDSLQIRRGNPNLKLFTAYNNSLHFYFKKGLLNTNIHIDYQYQDKPNMEETLQENIEGKDLFIRTKANQVCWQKFNPEINLKFGPIKDILTLSFTTGLNYFDSKGHTYHHTYSNWYCLADVTANYKNWSAFFQIQTHNNDFYGEKLTFGENYHLLGISYRHKQLKVGIMGFNLLTTNYKVGDENRSNVASSKNWMFFKESSNLIAANVSWNFSFGRLFQSKEKRLNNEDNDSGTLKTGR